MTSLEKTFRGAIPAGVDFCSLRTLSETHQLLTVRQGVSEPVVMATDAGAMITVVDGGGIGYAATTDTSASGLAEAAKRAHLWAKQTAATAVMDFSAIAWPHPKSDYSGPEEIPWDSVSPHDKLTMLADICGKLKTSDKIVDWAAGIWHTSSEMQYLTSDGGCVHQRYSFMVPQLSATANEGALTQTRTLGGHSFSQQGGMEVLDRTGFHTSSERIANEAVELLSADNCPTGEMDVLLAPDQMVLQIHESIGHPLELDRILGDERNYAGTSFVTPDMIGNYQYGSEILNVTYDPTHAEQLASFSHDDEGLAAAKTHIIRDGQLVATLGGTTSQARANLPGVANARACSWNRPAIDRMANLNLEPGDSTLDEMIAAIERGVYMKTNCSWSIDDSRNKFQFGCEWGRMIEDGKLTKLVRNSNYRGISATFWRSLKMIGRAEDLMVMGTPNCGKGEPNQCIRVGHASSPCVFGGIQVFGGV